MSDRFNMRSRLNFGQFEVKFNLRNKNNAFRAITCWLQFRQIFAVKCVRKYFRSGDHYLKKEK